MLSKYFADDAKKYSRQLIDANKIVQPFVHNANTVGAATNGASVAGLSIFIPLGSTGYQSWRGLKAPISSTLIGSRIRITIRYMTSDNISVTDISRGLNVTRNGVDYQSQAIAGTLARTSVGNKHTTSVEYVVKTGDEYIIPWIMQTSQTTLTSTGYITIIDGYYEVITQTLITENEVPYVGVYWGDAFNGAVADFPNKKLTIPAGQTGNSSWIYARYDVAVPIVAGSRFIFLLKFTTSSNLMANISGITPGLARRKDGVETNNMATASKIIPLGNDNYLAMTEYICAGGEEWVRPSIQVSNSVGALAAQGTIQITDTSFILAQGKNSATLMTELKAGTGGGSSSQVVTITKTVKQDGTGDYTSLSSANTLITDSSAQKIYDVYVYPGVYNEIVNEVKDYLNFIGIDKNTCIVNGVLPDDTTDLDLINNSTLWLKKNNTVKNLTITCKNCKYPIHDESNNAEQNWTRYIINCKLEHLGNEGMRIWRNANPGSGMSASTVLTETAFGYGASSGAVATYEDVHFKSPHTAYYIHNRANFTKACIHNMRRCKLESTTADGFAIRTDSMGSGQNDKIYMDGCELIGRVYQANNPWIATNTERQVSNRHEIDIVANNCSPAIYIAGYSGIALKIASSNVSGTSTVRISGDAVPFIFGNITYKDGGGGCAGYCYGSLDISGANVGIASDTDVDNTIGERLGDCATTNKTLVVTFEDATEVTITFNLNYTDVTNATILTTINTALSTHGTASEVTPPSNSFPFKDHLKTLKNVSAVYIPAGYAVVYDTNYMSIRLMTSTDNVKDFVGIAYDNIMPNTLGKVQTKGYFRKSGVVFGDKMVVDPSNAGKPIVNNSATDWIAKGLYADYYGFNL